MSWLNKKIDKKLYSLRLPNREIKELFKDEYLSQSSQNRQLKHMEEYLEKFKIHLRCVNSYVWIDGKENQIRKAIQWTLLTVNKNNISEKLGVEISKFDQKFVENQLSIIEDFYNSEVVLFRFCARTTRRARPLFFLSL